jgi:hypothetical protein
MERTNTLVLPQTWGIRVAPFFVVPNCSRLEQAWSTRAFRRSQLARSYIRRLIVFRRLTCPSTRPLLHGYSSPGATPASS